MIDSSISVSDETIFAILYYSTVVYSFKLVRFSLINSETSLHFIKYNHTWNLLLHTIWGRPMKRQNIYKEEK